MSTGPYLWLMIILIIPKDVAATNGTLGSLFILTFPRLTYKDNANTTNITIHAATFSETPFEVTFQFVHNERPGQDKQKKVIRRGRVSTFVVNKTLRNEGNVVRKGVFKLDGKGRFGLTVLMFGSSLEISTFTGVPVEAWGKEYFAVTLNFNAAIEIISAQAANRIEIHYMISSYLTYPNFTFENSVFDSENLVQHFTLKSYEAVSFADCQDEETPLSLTATNISGELPFGVISGSCMAYTQIKPCSPQLSQHWGSTSDPATEMLAPTGHWGTEFIIMTIPDRLQQGCAKVINVHKINRINITSPDRKILRKFMLLRGIRYYNLHILDFNLRINSNHPVQVAYIQKSACPLNDSIIREPFGDPSLCMLTPNDLFFAMYIWMLPNTPTNNYAALVSEKENCPFITLDNNQLPSGFVWQDVFETPSYSVGHLELPSGHHEVRSSEFKKFGCYFYGLEKEVMFMHPGGYQACDSNVDPTVGDLIDNDCDGSIDEEEADYSDDDDDGLIDEDTRKTTTVDGHWGEWEEWFCNPDCSHRKFVRLRHCDNPPPKGFGRLCVGDVIEFNHISECEPEKTLYCPELNPGKKHDEQPTHRICSFKRWGPNCTGSCKHCVNDCDEHTGACSSCQRGYKNAAGGCGKVCDVNEYGFDCIGSCLEKCGVDCLEREFGECPHNLLHFLVLLVVLPVCFMMILLSSKCSRKPKQEYLVNNASLAQKMLLEDIVNEPDVNEANIEDNNSLSEENKSQVESVAKSTRSSISSVTNPFLFGSKVDP